MSCGAYLALTKPRIVELLLVTTVPAMLLAAGGLPPLWLVAVVLLGGSLAAGGASALNCYIDRDIDQVMRRTKRRPLPAHTVTPRSALIFGLVLAAVSVLIMAVFTNWLATGLTLAAIVLLRRGLHVVAQAHDPAEHLLGWHLRRRAGAHRLGGGDRLGRPRPLGAVRGGLLLADAALLRPGHQVQGRLRAGRHPDAAGGGAPPPGSTPRSCCSPGDRGRVRWRVAAGASPVYGAWRVVTGGLFLVEAHRLVGRSRRGEPLKPMRLFHWSTTYLTVVFVPWRSTRWSNRARSVGNCRITPIFQVPVSVPGVTSQ
jgi:protoheme IX farnesyltransferase